MMDWQYWWQAASRYPEALWFLFIDLAPWLFLGLFLAGVVEIFFPESRVRRWLGQGRRGAIFKAALVGVPLPLCSCGVVPVALSLRRRGASRGATISFLITTPQSGVDSISATWGMMGAPFAILRTLLTFISGLAAGYVVQWFDRGEEITLQDWQEPSQEPSLPWYQQLFAPGWSILVSISRWLIVGILLAALIEVLIPDDFVSGGILAGPLGLLVMTAVGLPLYVCATASIPLALEFVDKGFSPGAAFVFLLVGPATNMATALIVRKEIGQKAMMAYLGSIVVFGLIAGWLIDFFIAQIPQFQITHHIHEGMVSKGAAVLLIGALLFIEFRTLLKKVSRGDKPMNAHQLKVTGMTCDHCRRTVEKALSEINGVTQVYVDLEGGEASFSGGDLPTAKKAIVAAGFEVS